MWVEYPACMPDKNGYYMTYYFNTDLNKYLYKAIAFYQGEWVRWRDGIPKLRVIAFLPESFNEYYVPCVIKFEDNWVDYNGIV